MTTTTATETKPRALPWGRYSEEMERTLAAHGVTEASIAATVAAHNAKMAAGIPARTQTITFPQPAQRTVNGLTDKQIKLVDGLLSERVHQYTDEQVSEAKADWRKGRTMIDSLFAAPRKPRQAPVRATKEVHFDTDLLVDGNYALYQGDPADNEIKFYRVSTVAGDVRKVQVRASDNLFPIDNVTSALAILNRIVEVGAVDSRMLFATKLEHCWKCGRSLSKKDSREYGMGADCREKYGF